MKQFWTITKNILVLFGFAGAIWGVFELIDTFRDGMSELNDNMTEFSYEIKKEVENNRTMIDSVLDVSKINKQISSENRAAINKGMDFTQFLIEHQAELTREQQRDIFLLYRNDLYEIKKNSKPTVSN